MPCASTDMKYAEVLLPVPLANTFTYRIPEAMADLSGLYCRVIVPFGKKHFYTGIIIEIHDRCPEQHFEIKELVEIIDNKPIITARQLSFWRWISSYYLCTLGEVCKAALPAGLKIESTSLKTGFKPKTETFLRLADHIRTEADIQNTMERIKRAKLQAKLFLAFLKIGGIVSNDTQNKTVSKKLLLEHSGVNASVLNGLRQRGILVAEEKVISRIDFQATTVRKTNLLSIAQQQAFNEIKKTFETNDITLLHGDQSDGKSAICIRLIQDAMSKGSQVLYLLPEIALTVQITERLKKVFGVKLFIYNSAISDHERIEIWNQLLDSDEPLVVLGVRSSIFLPFNHLGLVIVDEEHEGSYKQQDPAPRYHARNAAMMLALQHKAKTLLGTSTPSLESWLWAKKGKYGYVKVDNRLEGSLKPRIEIVNISELRRKKLMKDSLFSPLLKTKIDEALSEGEQVIIFQNRRGFAPFVACPHCGDIPHCVNCDVSLTYHKQSHRLTCHYCGYSIPFPLRCASCGSDGLKLQGFGTESIEAAVAALFPSAKVARLDIDTARTESAYWRILKDFEEEKTQILIGTQMVSKGLNLANVSVVGFMNIDAMMNIPDFRAYERAFQLMVQICGYAVRSDRQGWVVIQTMQTENELLHMVRQFDYSGMAQTQLKERHQFRYPPYTRLIILILRSRNEQILDEMADLYVQLLRIKLGAGVSGPVFPPVTRVQTLYVRKIMIKIELSLFVSNTRKILEEVQLTMQQNPGFRQIILHYDVDPQ